MSMVKKTRGPDTTRSKDTRHGRNEGRGYWNLLCLRRDQTWGSLTLVDHTSRGRSPTTSRPPPVEEDGVDTRGLGGRTHRADTGGGRGVSDVPVSHG